MRGDIACNAWRTTLLGCLATLLVAAEPRLQEPPKALALLVGIDKYAQPDGGHIADLKGAANDIDKVQRLLQTRFGFRSADIVTLRGPRATHEAIVRAFHDHLIARAGPDTQVVLWFSGHGSRVPDPSGKDTSLRDADDQPKDDTLVAYDSRAGGADGSRDITDDELHSLLAALRARQILVVTDCCHSGGVMRSGQSAAVRATGDGKRPLDRDALRRFWPADVPFLDDDAGELAQHYVHMAACGSDQVAGELACFGRSFGTLTWFLTDILAEVGATTSWRTVGELVRARVAGVGSNLSQLVQWSGDAIDRAILGGRGAPVPQGFAVHSDQGTLRVAAGRIHGLGDGSELAVFGLDEAVYGTMRVRQSHATWSEVVWLEQTRPVANGTPIRARPHGALQGRAPLRIRLGPGVDATLLADCAWAAAAELDPEYGLTKDGPALALVEPDGTFVRRVPVERRAAHAALFHEYCFRSLWEGVAQPGSCRIDVSVSEVPAAAAAEFALPVARLSATRGQPLAEVMAPLLDDDPKTGAVLELTLTNHGTSGVHVAALSVAEDRKVTLVWGEDANNFLAPGARTTQLLRVGASARWRRERPMIDRYVVIATPQWADFRAFTSDASPELTRGVGQGSATLGLPEFLQLAQNGTRMRGGDVTTFGVTWFDLVLVPPATNGTSKR